MRYRSKILYQFNARILHQKKLDNYIKENTIQRTIFEWSPYSSITGSDTSSSSSFVAIEFNDDWVDMKKLL